MKSVYSAILLFVLAAGMAAADSPKSSDEFWDGDKDAHFGNVFNWRHGMHSLFSNQVPYISVDYGFAQSSIHEDAFAGSISDGGLISLKFGHKSIRTENKEVGIHSLHDSYVFLERLDKELYKKDNSNTKIDASIWGGGLGWRNGYGYRIASNGFLMFTHADEFSWTRTDFKNKQNLGQFDTISRAYLDVLSDGIRFGNAFEAGIELQPIRNLSFNFAFRREAIMPRMMFWYWCLNYGIEQAAQGIVHSFTNEIMKSSPAVAPVVQFVLSNAMAYGMYELRKKNMNWPTSTAPAFVIDNYKLGLSFNF